MDNWKKLKINRLGSVHDERIELTVSVLRREGGMVTHKTKITVISKGIDNYERIDMTSVIPKLKSIRNYADF